MKKTRILSLLITTGVLSTGIAMAHTNIEHNTIKNNIQNIRLLANNTNASYGCVINGNSNLILTNKSGEIISYLSTGQMLKLDSNNGNKTFVTVKETGESGYISNNNIKYITSAINERLNPLNESASIINVTSNVNIRENATMNSNVLTTLNNLTNISIIGSQGNWFKVNVNGFTGYIFDEYVSQGSSLNTNINNQINSNIDGATTGQSNINTPVHSDLSNNNTNNTLNSNVTPSSPQVNTKKINNKVLSNPQQNNIDSKKKDIIPTPNKINHIKIKNKTIQNNNAIGETVITSNTMAPSTIEGLFVPINSNNEKMIPKNTTVKILKIENNLLYVDYNGYKGWVPTVSTTGFLNTKPEIINTNKPIGHITVGVTFLAPGFSTPICNAPTIKSKYLSFIPDNGVKTSVPVYDINGDWYEVNYNGTIGWINSKLTPCGNFTKSSPVKKGNLNNDAIGQTVVTSGTVLTPFAGDGINSEQIKKIKITNPVTQQTTTKTIILNLVSKNTTVNVLKVESGFLYIDYNDCKGWIPAVATTGFLNSKTELINTSKKPIGKIVINTSSRAPGWSAPLCSAPTIKSKYLDFIPDACTNTLVPVYAIKGNWCEINYNGTIGWINTHYLYCGPFQANK